MKDNEDPTPMTPEEFGTALMDWLGKRWATLPPAKPPPTIRLRKYGKDPTHQQKKLKKEK